MPVNDSRYDAAGDKAQDEVSSMPADLLPEVFLFSVRRKVKEAIFCQSCSIFRSFLSG
jgi:hypothetical protein